jgi:hypothetical protein
MKPTMAYIAMGLLGLTAGSAAAQTVFPTSVPTPRAVSVGDTAYWLGKPQVLIAADVDDLHVSPDRRFVLAICRNPQREPFDATEDGSDTYLASVMDKLPRVSKPRTGTVSLVVFDSQRGRAATIWRREATTDEKLVLDGLCWLADSKTALATVSVITLGPQATRQSGGKPQTFRPESVDTSLLLISADRRSARPLPLLAGNEFKPMVQIVPAPSTNRALVTVRPTSNGASLFRFVDATGTLTPPIPAEIKFSYFSGWTEDGSKITGFAMPNSRSGWTETRDISVDGKTGAVTLTERIPGVAAKAEKVSIPEWRESAVDKGRPVRLSGEKVTLPPTALGGDRFTVSPVLLQSAADPKNKMVVAPDGEPVGIVGDNETMTLLYRSHDALCGVALRKAPRSEYETAVRRLSRLRANGINDDLAVWRLGHGNQYPNPGTDIAVLFRDKPVVTGDAAERFLDPITGKPAFTYLYRGSVGGESTPLFSFASVGGRFVFYTGGYQSHWIPDGTPIPPTEPKGVQ